MLCCRASLISTRLTGHIFVQLFPVIVCVDEDMERGSHWSPDRLAVRHQFLDAVPGPAAVLKSFPSWPVSRTKWYVAATLVVCTSRHLFLFFSNFICLFIFSSYFHYCYFFICLFIFSSNFIIVIIFHVSFHFFSFSFFPEEGEGGGCTRDASTLKLAGWWCRSSLFLK